MYIASMIAIMIQRGTKLTRRRTSSEVNQHPKNVVSVFLMELEISKKVQMGLTSSNVTVAGDAQADRRPGN